MDAMAILLAIALGISEYTNDMRWVLYIPAMLSISILFVNSRMQEARRFNFRTPEAAAALVGLMALPFISVFLSPDPYISLIDALSYSVLFAAVLFVSTTPIHSLEALPVTAATVMLPFVSQGLVQVLQPGVNAHGGMHDSNLYAGFLTAGAALLAYSLVNTRHQKRTFPTYVKYALLGAIAAGAYIGHSRGAWLALTVATSLSMLVTKRHTGISYIKIVLVVGALAVAGTICTTHKTELDAAQHDRYGQSTNSRLAMWQSTIHMIKDHPLKGVGFGLWHIEYPNYRVKSDTDSAGFHAHNDYLEAFASGGIIGGVAVLAIPALWVLGLWRSRKVQLDSPWNFVGASVASGVFVLQAVVNFEFHDLAPALLAGISLGMMFAHLRKGTPIATATATSKVLWATASLGVTGSMLVTYLAMAPTLILQNPNGFEGRYLGKVMNPRVLLLLANVNPFSADPYFTLAQEKLVQGLEATDPKAKSDDFVEAIKYFQLTEARQGVQAGTAYKRAMLSILTARTQEDGVEKAEKLLRVSLSRNPGYWPSVNAYARLQAQRGTPELALPVLSHAEDVVPLYQRRNIERLRSEMLSGQLGKLY